MTRTSAVRRSTALALAAGAAALAGSAPAAAHDVAFSEGTTKLKLSKTAAGALQSLGVSAKGTRFRVVEGPIFSLHSIKEDGGGRLNHRGTLTLRSDATRVRLRNPVIRIARNVKRERGSLSVRVGGKNLRVGKLALKRYKVTDDGGFRGLGVRLTAAGARALNAAFGTSAFKRGLNLGKLSSKGLAAPLDVLGGATTAVLTQEAVKAFTDAGATLAPIAPASGAGTAESPLSFPITPTKFDYFSFVGRFAHDGGLRITFKDGSTFDVAQPSIAYDGGLFLSTGGTQVFELRFAEASTLSGKAPRVTFGGLDVFLTKGAAELLAPKLGASASDLQKLKIATAGLNARVRVDR